MSFQTHKLFVHLWNTVKIFLMKPESFLSLYATDTLKLQKLHKETVKLIHMN